MELRPAYAAWLTAAAALGLPIGSASAASTASAGDISNLDTPPPDLSSGLTNAGSLAWVIVALLIVIALIIFVIRFLANRSRAWGANRSLRSLGGVQLGQNKSLQAVEVGGKLYIVGVGEDVTLLDRIEDAEEAERMMRLIEQPQPAMWNAAGFGDLWNRLRGRQAAQPAESDWRGDSFESMLQDSLERQADRKQRIESLISDSNRKDRLMDE